MTDPLKLAQLIAATNQTASSGLARQPELGFHQGVVVQWNSSSNTNVVDVAGSQIRDVSTLATNDSTLLRPGDFVGLLRFRSTYFLLGRITLPGVNRSLGMQVGTGGFVGTVTSTTYTDITGFPGPLVTTYIGSARRAMVWTFSTVSSASNTALFTCQVFTSSLVISETATGLLQNASASPVQAGLSAFQLVTADHGLPGDTDVTFIMKFRVTSGSSSFGPSNLIVWPF